MVFYNVTCNLDESIANEWITWMKTEHLPEVMSTRLFESFRFCKLVTEADDNEGLNFSIQYKLLNMANFEQYKNEFAPAMRNKTLQKWGEKVLSFRSIMEEI